MIFRRKRGPAPLPTWVDDGSLPVVLEAYDAAVADSAVLGDRAGEVLLVRHHLDLPPAAVETARDLLGQEDYRLTVDGSGDMVQVRAWRVQALTVLSASQERSRMAGLAQRLGGDVRGWDACAPAVAAAD